MIWNSAELFLPPISINNKKMERLLLTLGLLLTISVQSNAQEYGTWYVSGAGAFKIIPNGNSFKVMWSSDDWASDERISDSTTSVLLFDKKDDAKLIYFEYSPEFEKFTGKFVFDDKEMDSGTYIRNDGNETRFSKASFQKDWRN